MSKNARYKNSKVLAEEKQHLLFGVKRSIRYHQHRVRYFDTLNRLAALFIAIGGVATLVAMLVKAPMFITLAFAIIVVTSSIFELVVNTAYRARLHVSFTKRFYLLKQAIMDDSVMTKKTLDQWKAARLDIESDAPPTLTVLVSICHNEELLSMGYDEKHTLKISRLQRLMANVMDIGEHRINGAFQDAPNP